MELWRLIFPRTLAATGAPGKAVLMIDGLDESQAKGDNALLDFLFRGLDQLPNWIGLVVSSRPEAHVQLKLNRFQSHQLLPSGHENDTDIKLYICKSKIAICYLVRSVEIRFNIN